MPIVGHDKDVHVEYNIPTEIDIKIPSYFYIALAGELCSILGPQIFNKITDLDEDTEEEFSYYDFDSGTAGWYAAFKATCKKLDLQWLLNYYDALKWYDRDIFDDIIEDRVVTRFIDKDNHCNEYYKYLMTK